MPTVTQNDVMLAILAMDGCDGCTVISACLPLSAPSILGRAA